MAARNLDLKIFHYHLLPGGVTDVIRHSLLPLAGLPGILRIEIICGRQENTEKMAEAVRSLTEQKRLAIPVDLTVLPEIDYLEMQSPAAEPEKLKRLLLDRFSAPEAVWLVHNYHLGKNWVFTEALNRIAREGKQKLIYQIHDFPECARFANLHTLKSHIGGTLYPRSDTLRYCVINQRDYTILREAGIPPETLFLLENPLPLEGNPAQTGVDRPALIKKLKKNSPRSSVFHTEGALWLYPVRSIRRKNVLEGGLITSLIDDPVNLILTLPGISPQEKSYSDLCEKAFSRGLIPGFWGTGVLPPSSGIAFSDLIAAADLIYSSSVQEGFGYMYLNALLWQKPLLARYLDIMEGFLPLMEDYPAHLYRSVEIPAGKELKNNLKKEYLLSLEEPSARLPESIKMRLKEDLHNIFSKDSIDFSYLSPGLQYEFLILLQSSTLKSECRDLNRAFLTEYEKLNKKTPFDKERDLDEGFGEKAYTEAFTSILDSFAAAGRKISFPEEEVDDNLLARFAVSEFFRLLYR